MRYNVRSTIDTALKFALVMIFSYEQHCSPRASYRQLTECSHGKEALESVKLIG